MSRILIRDPPIAQNNGIIFKLNLDPKFLDTEPRIQ